MRVLHVVPCLDPVTGGPAHSVPALCRALQAAGVDIVLYTFRRPGAAVTISPRHESFQIRWFRPLPGSRQWPTITFYQSLREAAQQFDLVHLHSLWNPAISVAASACRQARVPYILSPRGMLQDGALRRKLMLKRIYYWLWETRTIEGARALHFFTQAEALDSRQLLDGNTPIIVFPSGVDPHLARGMKCGEFRRAYPLLKGKRIMLFLGRLHWSKGLELQARALSYLVEHVPDLMWVLVGPDNGEWRKLSRQVRAMGLERHVLWTGSLSREKCLEALSDADVFLLTSRHEAHSMAMNEALAIGVPLIITNTVQFEEVKAWGAGYVVPWDPKNLAAAIADILEHSEKAQNMREAGRQLVAERLAWPKVAEAMVKRYEEILATKPQQMERRLTAML